jgi:hypothetical protein
MTHGAAAMGNERKWTVLDFVRREKGKCFFQEHGKWGEYASRDKQLF